MKRWVPLLVAGFLLSGCQPRFYDFYVIVIPHGEAVEALATAKAANAAVWFDDPVVTQYRISRDGYTLLGRLDFQNAQPAIEFAAHGVAGEPLNIVPLRYGDCGSFEPFSPARDVNGYPARRYRWRPAWNEQCQVGGHEPFPPGQVIQFEVRGAQGELVGAEAIPFELRANGTYVEYDGL